MKFLTMTLLHNVPNVINNEHFTEQEMIHNTLELAKLVEELGYDAFGVGERHGTPFLSSSPTALLAAIAVKTEKIRLFPTLSVLSILDPVRVAEDYATIDHISKGRLEFMIGKGNDPRHFPLFDVKEEEQWEALGEKYHLLKRLWEEENVSWSGKFRSSLTDVTTEPRPFQPKIRIWHGSASSTISTDLAAQNNDPLFSANGFHHLSKYTDLADHYRQRLAHYGHDPSQAVIGVGSSTLYIADSTEEAIKYYRPYYEAIMKTAAFQHNQSPFQTIEEHIEKGTLLVGSPEKIVEKILEFHDGFGHQIQAISVGNLRLSEQKEQLERFAKEVIPVLRKKLPDTLWEVE